MKQNEILKVTIENQHETDILEKIKKYTLDPRGFFHVVSLNPENLVLCQKDNEFREIVETAQIKIVDGVGVVVAGRILQVKVGDRVTGVGLMSKLLTMAGESSLTVMLIGSKENLAFEIAKCYQQKYPKAKFIGIEGIKNIKNPLKEEEQRIFHIVTAIRPHLIFLAFGSPYQEKWVWKHREALQGTVCMGVGGAFDYLGGAVKTPPKIICQLGMEWLFRLVNQPWRWKRQLRLMEFLWLVAKEKVTSRKPME